NCLQAEESFLSAWNEAMFYDLAKAFKSLNGDSDVKVIIVTGAGHTFCSGVDVTSAQAVFKGDLENMDADPVYQMERCRKPIISAINGYVATAGFELALACNILIASTDAKFIDIHCNCKEKNKDSKHSCFSKDEKKMNEAISFNVTHIHASHPQYQ
ncbi:hypothetical protein KI387_032592, partial [Taxus chinensis]